MVGSARQRLAFCENHRQLVDDLLAVLAETAVGCPICRKSCADRAAMVTHLRRTHGYSIEDFEPDPGAAAIYFCTIGSCTRTYATSQQLGAHVWNEHQRPDRR
jgi:hypothetical protein